MQQKRSRRKRKTEYVYGNTVRKLKEEDFYKVKPKQMSKAVRKNRMKADSFGLPLIVFFTILTLITAFSLMRYLKLQSDVLTLQRQIEKSELYYYQIKEDNDNTQKRLEAAVSFEKIKQRAMDELGMKYPKKEQIVYFESGEDDYVRQIQSIE